MKNAIIIISIVLLGQSSYCQDSDTIKPKLFNHFIGVQGNELIRQVFNFNNTTANNSNPYLLTYHINFARSGWGLRVGAAYSNRVFTTDDGITANKSNLNDLRLRFGIERAFRLSDRWSCGAGLDGIMKHDDNKTQSRVVNFDTTTTNITSLVPVMVVAQWPGFVILCRHMFLWERKPAFITRWEIKNRILKLPV